MYEFLHYFDDVSNNWFPMHLNITYNKMFGWCIEIWKKGCADDYPKSKHKGDDALICSENNPDMELAFAKAYVQLKEWLSDNTGGN